jgi:3-deoxy-D-manno-octulosonic-acid transferase
MAPFRHLLYNLTLILLALPIAAFTLWQAVKRRGGGRFILQRILVHRAIAPMDEQPLWVHAASIGEVKAMLPVLDELLLGPDIKHCLLTTNTPEAARLVEKHGHIAIRHRYCPIDWPFLTAWFVNRINPRAVLIAETEIWPNLYRAIGNHLAPLIIVNGRLSAKTLDQPGAIRQLLGDALTHVDQILARAQTDVEGFEQLGVAAANITLCGNIKLAARRRADTQALAELADRRYCLAVSTHAPEERLLAQTLLQLPEPALMVIVPRHPQRSADIQSELAALGVAFAVRSKAEPPVAGRSIYLADTVGEVEALISAASFVYVGGSLAPIGGHNVLEPAAWGKAVISGPALHNFTEEAELLQSFDALLLVQDESELTRCFRRLYDSGALQMQYGNAARLAIDSCHSTLARYVEELNKTLNTRPAAH